MHDRLRHPCFGCKVNAAAHRLPAPEKKPAAATVEQEATAELAEEIQKETSLRIMKDFFEEMMKSLDKISENLKQLSIAISTSHKYEVAG